MRFPKKVWKGFMLYIRTTVCIAQLYVCWLYGSVPVGHSVKHKEEYDIKIFSEKVAAFFFFCRWLMSLIKNEKFLMGEQRE